MYFSIVFCPPKNVLQISFLRTFISFVLLPSKTTLALDHATEVPKVFSEQPRNKFYYSLAYITVYIARFIRGPKQRFSVRP